MMKSLSSRLVLTAVLLVAVVSLLIGTTTTLIMRDNLTDRLDSQVRARGSTRFTDGHLPGPVRTAREQRLDDPERRAGTADRRPD